MVRKRERERERNQLPCPAGITDTLKVEARTQLHNNIFRRVDSACAL